jgi:hypothetical protein
MSAVAVSDDSVDSDEELSSVLVVVDSELEELLSVDVDDELEELLPQPTSPATIEVAKSAANNFFFIKNPPMI